MVELMLQLTYFNETLKVVWKIRHLSSQILRFRNYQNIINRLNAQLDIEDTLTGNYGFRNIAPQVGKFSGFTRHSHPHLQKPQPAARTNKRLTRPAAPAK